jgi:hypothetical protein
VTVSLRGFGASESVLVTFDTGNGTRSLVRVRASSLGIATAQITIPPSTRGLHRVTGQDDAGHTSYAHFRVQPSMIADSPVAAGDWSAVTLRGFLTGETVELRWGSETGAILRTKVVTASGSGTVNVLIPADSTDGNHSLWAVGNGGTRVRVTVTTLGAAEDPTATATSSPEPTATSEPSETSTIAVSSETPTSEAPTLTVTPSPGTPVETLTATLEATSASPDRESAV